MNEAIESCPHAGSCGGCGLRPMNYEQQLAAKENEMKKLFLPVLGEDFFADGRYEGILPSPKQEGYRNKMEYTFGNAEKNGPLMVGMHRKGRFFDVIEVPQCRLVHPDLNVITAAVQAYFREKEVPFFHKMNHAGILRHLVLRRSESNGELLINLVTRFGYEPGEEFLQLLLELPLEGKISGILHTENDSLSDAVIPEKVTLLWGRDWLEEHLLGLRFKITPFSFFQTNSRGAEVLYTKAREYVGEIGGSTVFDLYSGTGTIAQLLAARAGHVTGVEIVAEAVQAARENAAANGLTNCTFHCGDVLTAVDDIGEVPDYIVVDPPRDGVHPKALPKLMRFGAARMVYISCKPKSLARDIPALRLGGYEPVRLALVDMFPFTPNVEAVCLLKKTEI